MDAKIFRVNYKSDFILTLTSDAGWMTPFCIKFWTGAPSQAYYAQWDGETYTHCAYDPSEPTKLTVQFDDHHLPIGDLKYQVAYHFTVADFPNDTEDEVLNQANITTEIDGEEYQVMLDFNGETSPVIQYSFPAYANEAQRIANEQQRIANEQQRIANEESRIAAETIRQQNEAQRISNEESRVAEFAQLKQESETATADANSAATLANEKAALAADKTALAQAAATLANEKAQLAAAKAALAAAAATLANDKAALAQQKAAYAQAQGDYAKAQGDYAKAQGDTAQADHERAEADHTTAADDHQTAAADHTTAASDHTRAEGDHTTAASDHSRAEVDHSTASADHTTATNDHTQAVTDHTTATSDHTQAGSDHTRAESDHTRAESDHAAVEVYVDSLGAFDISAYHATGGVLAKYADLTAALGTGGANIPEALRKGGMSVKFALSSDNKYVQYRLMAQNFTTDVTQWQGVDDEPTAGSDNLVKSGGAESKISDCKVIAKMFSIKKHYVYTSTVDGSIAGIAIGNTLKLRQNNSFSVSKFKVAKGQVIYIPFVLGKNTANPVIVDDNDIVLQIGDQSASSSTVHIKTTEFWPFTIQYDGYLVYAHYVPDDIPLYSDNAAMRLFDNPYVYVDSETSGEYMNFVKACYVRKINNVSVTDLKINSVRRNYDGAWLVQISDGSTTLVTYTSFVEDEKIVCHTSDLDIYLILNWNVFQSSFNDNVDIHFSKLVWEIEGNLISEELIKKEALSSRIIGSFAVLKEDGYVNTSDSSGTPRDLVGKDVSFSFANNWGHIKVPVIKNETLYVPYIVGNFTTKNPIIVDGNNKILQIGDYTQANAISVLFEDFQYWKIKSQYNGFLIFSLNKNFNIYSDSSTTRISVVAGSSVPFDFETAKSMDHALLRSIIESASNGKCTVLYDDNGYPNLMYKIPLMSIGMFSTQLGDMNTPHPAFVVNGTTKKCLYAGVFMNAEYNGVPVSWFGLGNIMRSKSFFECRTLCAAKGDGWHLETIWERSLISLLSAKHHNNKPRGNNCWGRSRKEGFEYECVERVDGKIPGTSADSNGCQWINGTEPDTWSHDNSRWGIFDIVGGYHEFCNLVKIVDGQIYIANDNKYNSDESEWSATGIYVGHDNQIQFSGSQQPIESGLKTGRWSLAICTDDFDSIDIAIRKKVAIALMCPKLSSSDENPIFDFDGSIWVQRLDEAGYTTYPFLGGAEEYEGSGLGMNIMSYKGDAAHNNMGSRLFYIE